MACYSYYLSEGETLRVELRGADEQPRIVYYKNKQQLFEDGLHNLINLSGNLDPIVMKLLRYDMPWQDIQQLLGPGGKERGSGTTYWVWDMTDGPHLTFHLGFLRGGEKRHWIYVDEGTQIEFPELQACIDPKVGMHAIAPEKVPVKP